MQINPYGLYSFPNGIPAFESITEFDVNPIPNTHCYTLCSKKYDTLFFCINPLTLYPNYLPQPNTEDLQIIEEINEPNQPYLIICILTIPKSHTNITTNLKGPIILNPISKKGTQSISNCNYTVQFPTPIPTIQPILNILTENNIFPK